MNESGLTNGWVFFYYSVSHNYSVSHVKPCGYCFLRFGIITSLTVIFLFTCFSTLVVKLDDHFLCMELANSIVWVWKKRMAAFLPGIIYLVNSLVIVITDKVVLHTYYFYENGADKDFDEWYQLSGFVFMVVYFLFSLRYFNLFKKLTVQVVSYADVLLFRWVKNFLYAFLTMLMIRLFFFICGFIPAFLKLSYIGLWWEYSSFAIVIFYIAITSTPILYRRKFTLS